MKKLTNREQWLFLLFAAVAILGIHVGIVRPPLEARDEAAKIKISQAPAPGADKQAGKAQTSAQNDLDHEMKTASSLDRLQAELLSRWARPASRTDAVRNISKTLQDLGFEIASSGLANSEKLQNGMPAASTVAPALRALEWILTELGGAAPELRHFEIRGPFESLQIALDRLGAAQDQWILPVGLSMRPEQGTDHLLVDLYIWI